MTETNKNTQTSSSTQCRVCLNGTATPFMNVGGQDYWQCPTCSAVFLDQSQLPDRQTEFERYLLHNNDPQDPCYRKFLSKLAEPLLTKLQPGMKGLDFGCGAGPALGLMLTEMEYNINFYDPFFYQPDTSVLNETYDFIFCSEVVEHFHQPAREFARLDAMLKPDGWLGIMTCFLGPEIPFENWYYRRDPTHVVFYSQKTFEYLAWQYGWDCEIAARDVVLMRKSNSVSPLTRRLRSN